MSPARAESPLGFDIEAHGDETAARVLKGLGKRGADPRPVFQTISEELQFAEGAWFASHGRGAWPPLADRTLSYKASQGQPAAPLIATGALIRSLTVKRGSASRRTITPKQLRFGTRVPYAVFHQKARTGHSRLPARPPLVPVDTQTRRKMVKDVQGFLLHGDERERRTPWWP
jgi:phage gpG-like protein